MAKIYRPRDNLLYSGAVPDNVTPSYDLASSATLSQPSWRDTSTTRTSRTDIFGNTERSYPSMYGGPPQTPGGRVRPPDHLQTSGVHVDARSQRVDTHHQPSAWAPRDSLVTAGVHPVSASREEVARPIASRRPDDHLVYSGAKLAKNVPGESKQVQRYRPRDHLYTSGGLVRSEPKRPHRQIAPRDHLRTSGALPVSEAGDIRRGRSQTVPQDHLKYSGTILSGQQEAPVQPRPLQTRNRRVDDSHLAYSGTLLRDGVVEPRGYSAMCTAYRPRENLEASGALLKPTAPFSREYRQQSAVWTPRDQLDKTSLQPNPWSFQAEALAPTPKASKPPRYTTSSVWGKSTWR